MATVPRAYTSQKAHRLAQERGETVNLTQPEANALREQLPVAVGVLKARRKVVLKELAERLKRLAIVANELEIATAGGSVELPVAFWRLAMAPEDGL